MSEAIAAWAKTLKPGDEVAASDGYGPGFVIAKVVRTTDTQIIIDYRGRERRHRKDWGREVGAGSSYRASHIVPLTQDIRDKIERAALANWVSRLVTHGRTAVSLRVLRAMRQAFNDESAAEKAAATTTQGAPA